MVCNNFVTNEISNTGYGVNMTFRKITLTTLSMIAVVGLLGGVSVNSYAKDGHALPSAGINFVFSQDATSVKDIKDTTGKTTKPESSTAPLPSSSAANSASPQATDVASINPEDLIEEIPEEEKTVEETVVSKLDMSIDEKERELDAKQEEEKFKSLVIAQVNDYVNVRADASEDAEKVGKLYNKSAGTFISEKDGWYEIESGNCKGYVKAEYCVTGEAAIELAKQVGRRIATVDTTTLKVREEPSLEATVLGLVPDGEVLTVTEEMDGWVKVDIEEGIGYVSLDYVRLDTEFVKAESKEEEEARILKETREREAAIEAANKVNKSKSTKSTASTQTYHSTGSGSELGNAVANFGLQYVGNPYVYGGSSLTNGTDCSGFVMRCYEHFGVSLPHSSSADRSVGYAVDGLANAQPGDLICYSGHVALYIGGGQIVHASSAKTGIKVSNADYRTILAIRRIF